MTTTTEPTLLERLHALEVTARALVAERDTARAEKADALEAACELQQERDRDRRLHDSLANSLRAELDEAAEDKRALEIQCERLTATVRALEQQIDHMQNPPEQRRDDFTRRRPFRRGGNAL